MKKTFNMAIPNQSRASQSGGPVRTGRIGSTTWQKLSLATLLSCTLAGMPVAHAAEQEGAVLNMVNADIESVVKAVGHYVGITIIVDPRVKGSMTLAPEKPLSKAETLKLLSSTLRLTGNTLVMGDGFAKVVPESEAKLHSSPTQVAPVANPVKGDQIVSQIFRLNYESSTNLVTILRPLISPNNTVNANPGNNTLIITDFADNVTRLGKIIAALDTPSNSDIDVIPVRHAIASDIATMVTRLTESNAGPDGGRISVLADPRTNSVVLRAPSLARANFAKSLIAKLDQPTNQAGNVHVVYLKNADATKLAQTLRAVVSSDTSSPAASSSTSTQPSPQPNPGANQPGTLPPSTPAPQPLSSGGAAGFIQADATTNTLIITASEPVYRNLRNVIDLLDSRRAQVYIESLIVEVTSSKAAEFGIQWAGLSGNDKSNYRIGGLTGFNSTTGSNSLTAIAASTRTGSTSVQLPGDGFSVGVFRQINGALSLGALAHALETDGNANILSTPNLLTLDNEEAKIVVGKTVPFTSGSFTQSASGGGNPFQTFERKDVGLTLRVRPQISEGGTIKMAVFQETSSIDKSTAASAGGPTTNKRSIETNILADDNQIIVLGGLIEDSTSDGVDKVRGLADIPILGNFFKYQKRDRSKTNLLVFLRPVIIRTAEQSLAISASRYDYIRGNGEANKPAQTPLLPNTGLSTLPPLENGKPAGGDFIKTPQPAQPSTPAPSPAPQGKQ
ncbi:MAG: type secretion system protein GspD [Pseudomonadota bacterium]|jgi:general secretion pathway protein D